MSVGVLVPGAVTVRTVSGFWSELCGVCAAGRDVVLDLSGLEEADLSFVQLVQAARAHVAGAGVGDAGGSGALRLAAPAQGAVAALLARAGFAADPADIDFWFHGALPQ
ncbi:STAS domain-containing protein [Sphingobium sp. H39-3-25]|uniref:STAS domain-containing protein n=1 Tax=Sphingobium arseniciresistens TaxID=3030834 RepID=UPI0023B972C0|nr:STAS domain-containing protein [Sphingobium arseniciresistens]